MSMLVDALSFATPVSTMRDALGPKKATGVSAQAPGVRAAFEDASGLSPEQAAKTSELSGELGVSENVVLENPEAAALELRARQVEENPALSAWAARHRTNAAHVREDPALYAMFELMTRPKKKGALDTAIENLKYGTITETPPTFWESVDSSLPARILEGPGDFFKGALKKGALIPGMAAEWGYQEVARNSGILDEAESAVAQGLAYTGLTGGERTGLAGYVRDWALENADVIRREYLENESFALSEDLRGPLLEHPEYLLSPEYLGHMAGEAGASLLLMYGAGSGYSLLRGGASLAVPMAFSGALMESSAKYAELIREGVPNDRALSASTAFGVTVGLLEKFGLDKMFSGPAGKKMLGGIGDVFFAGASETVSEYAEEPAGALLSGLARGDSPGKLLAGVLDSLKNVEAIPGSFFLGSGIRGISRIQDRGQKAMLAAAREEALFSAADAARTKQIAPAKIEDAITFAMGNVKGTIAAGDALRLRQDGVPVLEKMGWELADVEEAASLGQDLTFSRARAIARFDRAQFDAFNRHTRADAGAMSAAENGLVEDLVQTEADSLAERFEEYAAEQNALDTEQAAVVTEMARLRGELETAVRSVPGLRNAVENAENVEAGQELDAEQAAVVDDYMGVYERLAALLARHGASPAERLRDIHFSGLARGPGGRLMTPEDAERAENARILKEADDAVWGSLWGRIDASSLKALGYSSSELRKIHGPGLFAPKGTGVSLDKLAQEMAETGLLPQDGGADALWERLKQGRARLYQAAMIRAEDATASDFARRVSTTAEQKKTYFEVVPEQGALEGSSVILPADSIRHRNKRHPDMTDADMDRLPQVLASLTPEQMRLPKKDVPRFAGKGVLAWAVVDGQHYGLALESVNPDRVIIASYFKGTENGIKAWFDEQGDTKKAAVTPAALWPAQVPPSDGNAFHSQPSSGENIADGAGEGNTLYQSAPPVDASPEEVRAGDAALARDVEAWGKSVDAFTDGTLPARQPVTMLNQTPLVLQMLGAKNLPVQTTSGVLDKVISRKHKLDPELVKQIPAAMADPIMVFQTDSDSAVSDMIMMLDLKDEKGATVVVPIALNRAGGDGYRLNLVPSMYVKNFDDTGRPNDKWFAAQIQNGNLLYQNNKKSRAWSVSAGRQLPRGVVSLRGGNKVATDADLVKLRNENPALYQSAPPVDSPLGYFDPATGVVQLLRKADLSTVLHETGHVFMREVEWLISEGIADERLQADYATLRGWVGAEPGAVWTREQQEKFARGFEAYLREGKAPARPLESSFSRFKKWLTRIYKQAVSLNVELTDDVRGVFDRLLATDAEIERVAEDLRVGELERSQMDALGLTAADRAYFSGLKISLRDAAEARLREQRDATRKENLRAWAKEASEEAGEERPQKTKAAMRAEGLDMDAVREAFGEEAASALRAKIPGMRSSGGGVADPMILAARMEYADTGAMIADVLNSPTKKQRVKEIISEKQIAHDARFPVEEATLETDAAAESLRHLSEVLASKIVATEAARAMNENALRLAVEQRMRGTPMGDAVKAHTFRSYAKRAMTNTRLALSRGDTAEALRQNEIARFNTAMARRSSELAADLKKLQNRGKRFVAMKKGDPDARFMVADIMARHGLDPGMENLQKLAEGKRDGKTFSAWMEKAEGEGFDVLPDPESLAGKTAWGDLSAEAFGDIAQSVNQIVHVERAMRQFFDGVKGVEWDEHIENVTGSILGNNKMLPAHILADNSKWYSRLRKSVGYLTKIEVLCMKLDGGKNGALWRALYKPVSDAEDARGLRMGEERGRMEALYGIYDAAERRNLRKDTIKIKSAGGMMISREKMLAIALNMGNAQNRNRLLSGKMPNGMVMQQFYVTEALSHMTEKDCRFVQSVWDYLDSFREESFSLDEKVNGIRPERVEPAPFTLRLADGSSFSFSGGYYPIDYDSGKSRNSSRGDEQRANDDLGFGTGFGASATTRKGHLEARAKAGTGAPLSLSLDTIQAHVFDVVTDITMRETAINAARLIRSRRVSEAITAVAGVETHKLLMPWLRRTVREDPRGGGAAFSAWLRGNLSAAAMGWKTGTALVQVSGLVTGMEYVGPGWVVRGLREVYGGTGLENPFAASSSVLQAYQRVIAESAFMAGRMKNQTREMRELNDALLSGKAVALDWFRKNAFAMIGGMQMFAVDLPVWVGAQARYMAENADSGNPARQKFEAAKTTAVTGREIFGADNPFPEKMADRRNAVIAWLQNKGWLQGFKNTDTGWDINVSKGSIRDTAAHGMDLGKAQVLAAIPDIIGNGVYIAPGKTRENGHKRYIFAAKANIEKERFVVAFVVEEDKNGKRFYNHELTEIENLDGPSLARQPGGIGLPEASRDPSVLDIVRKHLSVKPGKSEAQIRKEAVEYADQAVRLTQGSGKSADLSTIQNDGELFKLTTAFYSWFNTMYNLTSLRKTQASRAWAEGDRRAALGIAANFAFYAWAGTQALEILIDGLRDRWPDEDDPYNKEWGNYLAGKFLGFWQGQIPFARNVSFGGPYGMDFSLVPAERNVDGALRTLNNILKLASDPNEERAKKVAVGTIRTVGWGTGLPLEWAAQITQEVWDYMDGTTPEIEIRKLLLR